MKEAIGRGFKINPTDKNQIRKNKLVAYLNKKEEIRLFSKLQI